MRKLCLAAAMFAAVSTAAETPTFSGDVAEIVFNNCSTCHREGQGAPFALTSYQEVAKRGQLIAAVTQSRYMPPWHAERADFRFQGERRLSAEQIETIGAWVDAGMPEGDPARLPELPIVAKGWELGEPDMVVQMTEAFKVGADGPDEYRYFVLDLPLEADKWVRAIEFQPSSRATVHHVLGFLVDGEGLASDSTGKKYRDVPGTNDRSRVITWAIGSNARVYPDDVAVPFKRGQKLVVQTHFHPSGKVEYERSRVGLHFADAEPVNRYVEVLIPPGFGDSSGSAVPAGSDRYALRESFVLPVDVKAFSTFAHAHYLGKEFGMTAYLPNGDIKTLLKINDYDFSWQELYNFEDYVKLPAGTRLESYIRWDNRAENPANPYSPPREIRWGRYSADEMGSITVDVVPTNPADRTALYAALKDHADLSAANFVLSTLDKSWKLGKGTTRRGRKVLSQFDENGNGKFELGERAAARAFLASKGFDEGADRQPSD